MRHDYHLDADNASPSFNHVLEKYVTDNPNIDISNIDAGWVNMVISSLLNVRYYPGSYTSHERGRSSFCAKKIDSVTNAINVLCAKGILRRQQKCSSLSMRPENPLSTSSSLAAADLERKVKRQAEVLENEKLTSCRFNRLRVHTATDPFLTNFLKEMPKGFSLHNHLTGSIYYEDLLKIAIDRKLYYDPKDSCFHSRNKKGRVKAAKLKKNPRYYNDFTSKVSMLGAHKSQSGDKHFFDVVWEVIGSICDGYPLARLLKFIIERVAPPPVDEVDGIEQETARAVIPYLEIKTDFDSCTLPKNVAKLLKSLPLSKKPTKQQLNALLTALQPWIMKATNDIVQKLDGCEEELKKEFKWEHSPFSGKAKVTVKLHAEVSRLDKPETFFFFMARAMAAFVAEKKSGKERIVAVDISGKEHDPRSIEYFHAQMAIIDFLWNYYGEPNIVLHAGELNHLLLPQPDINSRIRQSIFQGHARRIAHGFSIKWEDNMDELLEHMAREQILVEICLSSNEGILNNNDVNSSIRDNEQPLQVYMSCKVPVSIEPDDRGINRSNDIAELVTAVTKYGLSYEQVKCCIFDSTHFAFCGESIFVRNPKEKVVYAYREEFADIYMADWQPSDAAKKIMNKSLKARLQVQHVKALLEFEQKQALKLKAGL